MKRTPIVWFFCGFLIFLMGCPSSPKELTPEEKFRRAKRRAHQTAQRASILILGRMRAHATKAVPLLLKTLDHRRWRLRLHAIRALGKIQHAPQKVLPALLKKLSSQRGSIRESARFAIARFGKDALPFLQTASRHSDKTRRVLVARTLAEIAMKEDKAVPLLVTLLKDKAWEVREQAGEGLSQARSKALRPYLPQLMGALVHTRANVSFAVANALQKLGRPAIGELLKGLQKKSRILRRFCAIVLGYIGQDSAKVVPALNKALQIASRELQSFGSQQQSSAYNETTSLVASMAESLGAFGKRAHREVSLLIPLLRHNSVEVRNASARALGDIGSASVRAVPVLKELVLKDKERDVRKQAIEALGKIGPAAAPAIPALIHALKSDWKMRGTVRDALAHIGEPAVPALLQVLKSNSGD